jgi:hypothetical protein
VKIAERSEAYLNAPCGIRIREITRSGASTSDRGSNPAVLVKLRSDSCENGSHFRSV